MGKKQTFQSNGFLNYFGWSRNPYSSQNMETWILIVRKKYGKTQTFQINGLLKYFGWSRNPYSSQNMGKVNSHSKGKIWENTNISKLSFPEIFRLVQKSMQLPKHEKWISTILEKYEKTQTFQIYGFLKYFGWSRNLCNSQNLGKVNFHNTGKVWEKNKHSKVMGFSTILSEAEIHSKRKIWENTNIPK